MGQAGTATSIEARRNTVKNEECRPRAGRSAGFYGEHSRICTYQIWLVEVRGDTPLTYQPLMRATTRQGSPERSGNSTAILETNHG